jgi:hypothetical protein
MPATRRGVGRCPDGQDGMRKNAERVTADRGTYGGAAAAALVVHWEGADRERNLVTNEVTSTRCVCNER